MPTSYRIDAERRVIFSSATGVVVDADLRSHQRSLLNDPDFDKGFDQLWDFGAVTRVEVSTAAVQELAKARSYEGGVKRALVAPKDAAFGMARMFQSLHDSAPETIRVLRSLPEAEAWLELE